MTIRTNGSISNLAGTGPANLHMQSAAKAWVAHSSAPAILDSQNISSLVDSGVGLFDFNVSSAFSGTSFSTYVTGSVDAWNAFRDGHSASHWRTRYGTSGFSNDDSAGSSASIGDLA
jgi:hypothetical protein